ncbi:MAG: hypothetical protein RL701_277 [Pseudomonadota bacterium]
MIKPESNSAVVASLIVTREYKQVLEKHGIVATVRLHDHAGQPPVGGALMALLGDLRAAQQRVEHARRLVQTGTLAASITHEIRNLLTGSLGFAQLLRMKAHEPESVKDAALLIETELRRCVEVLAGFLRMSRSGMEATAAVGVAELLAPVERLVGHSVQQRRCQLQVELSEPLPMVLGRASDLQRIFINLILNAADAAHMPGVQILVSAQVGPDGNVELRVSDNGPGIPDAIAERIFEPFFSTKQFGDGTGLGLAISRSIAEAHGGKLLLEPKTTPGATFLIKLPPAGKRLDGRTIGAAEVQ